MILREYQQRAIDELYAWFEAGNLGNPCLVLPTGAGKSHIVAALCKDALQQWPETQILMLTHVKELIEQNAEKMRQHWPDAPLGIYSASLGLRQLGLPITFAGIQSVRKKSKQIGHADIIIIDECHLVSHNDEGGYRTLIKELTAINPSLRVIGLTATPFRLGHGMITDQPAIFSDTIEPVGIQELIYKGYLAKLRSKATQKALDTTGVHKRGGEFIESELQAVVDTKENNQTIVQETIELAGDRKAWLFFCAGVDHAQNVKRELIAQGITAECVTGDTPKKERERILAEFKAGKIRALTNANVLTTGFDYPDIDLIALMRPTMSPVLYMQMVGRGMRPKSHADHCLVLDFAGVVATHGPITNVKPPDKKGKETGEAPVKVCPQCQELCALSAKNCGCCGHQFPPPKPPALHLRDEDIMGLTGQQMNVKSWTWREHIGKKSGNLMLSVTYYGELHEQPITEYLPILNPGYAGDKALKTLLTLSQYARCSIMDHVAHSSGLKDICRSMNSARPPQHVIHKKDGKFSQIIDRCWNA
jgi:DNA repair protein RadD